jgi:hypothetical protein
VSLGPSPVDQEAKVMSWHGAEDPIPGDHFSCDAIQSLIVPRSRHLWWNFVSSRPERIAQAKEDWRQGRFDTVPNDAEFIPLPEDPPPVRYP